MPNVPRQADFVGFAVDQLDLVFCQDHVEFVLGQVLELLLIDFF